MNLVLDAVVQAFSDRIKGDRNSKVKPGNLNSEELTFLIKMSQNPGLKAGSALQLLELLSTVYVGRTSVASVLLPTILELTQRFRES